MNEIWVEKYRPAKLDDVVGQEHVVKSLKAYAKSGSIPHMLFAGPAGVGKTTCAIALAKEFYGDTWRENFEELNASRCVVFRFTPISDEDMKNYLEKIAKNEGIEITEDGIKSILYISNGDMRRAINVLQVTASVSDKIDGETVYKMTSVARPEDAKKLIEMAIKGDFINARKILDKMIIEDGLSGEDIIKGLHNAIIDAPIKEEEKAKIIDKMGETEFRIVEGSNDRIQIEALISYLVAMRKS